MNNKQLKLIKKILFDQRIEYLFWGGMTTLVYFVVRFVSMAIFKGSDYIPVFISEVVSIAFAFVVNKYFVFNTDTQAKSLKAQLLNFLTGRLLVMALDFGMTWALIQQFPKQIAHVLFLDRIDYASTFFQLPIIHGLIGSPMLFENFLSVILIQVTAIVINYFVSKYFAFN